MIGGYALTLMVIFYLQNDKTPGLPSVFTLQSLSTTKKIINGCVVSFSKEKIQLPPDLSVLELMKNFFNFYFNFDFENNVISPFTAKTILKSKFSNVSELPVEFKDSKEKLANGEYVSNDFKKELCVQDPLLHTYNVTRNVGKNIVAKFQKFCLNSYKNLAVVDTPERNCCHILKTIFSHPEIKLPTKEEVAKAFDFFDDYPDIKFTSVSTKFSLEAIYLNFAGKPVLSKLSTATSHNIMDAKMLSELEAKNVVVRRDINVRFNGQYHCDGVAYVPIIDVRNNQPIVLQFFAVEVLIFPIVLSYKGICDLGLNIDFGNGQVFVKDSKKREIQIPTFQHYHARPN